MWLALLRDKLGCLPVVSWSPQCFKLSFFFKKKIKNYKYLGRCETLEEDKKLYIHKSCHTSFSQFVQAVIIKSSAA